MKNIYNIILKTAAAVLAVTLAAGCVFEKEGPSGKTRDVMVLLDVTTSDMPTKAVLDGGEEDPTAAESNISTVKIYAFDSNGRQIGYADNDNANGGKFHMVLQAPEGAATMTADFYVVANEGAMYYNNAAVSLPKQMTIAELQALRYSSLMTNTTDLPMYGIVKNKTLNLTQGSQHLDTQGGHEVGFLLTETLSIDLYRDLAKIGVYAVGDGNALTEITGADDRPRIHSVTLNAAGRRNYSYLLPAADDAALKTRDAQNTSLTNERVFNTDLLTDGGMGKGVLAETMTAAQFTNTEELKNRASKAEILAPFYLAEVPYGSNTWNTPATTTDEYNTRRPVVLTLAYSLSNGAEVKYVDVHMPAIQRNHFYKVFCFIKSEGTITLQIHVLDWEEGGEWVLTFDYPTHSNPVPASSSFVQQEDGSWAYEAHANGTQATMSYTYRLDQDNNIIVTDEGAFSVDFQMSAPTGQTWMPTFDGSSSDFEIRVYERDTQARVRGQIAASDKWYTIKVVPLKPLDADGSLRKVSLMITYTPSWLNELDFLIINGTNDQSPAWAEHSPVDDDIHEANIEKIVVTQIEPTGN